MHKPVPQPHNSLSNLQLVSGHRVTCFSNEEERAAGKDKLIPFSLQHKLEELGAEVGLYSLQLMCSWPVYMLSTGSVFQIDLSSVKQHPEVSLSLSLQLIATEMKLSSSVCKVIFLSGGYGAAGRRACHSQSNAPHRPEPCICKQVEGCHVLAVAAHKHISSAEHIWSLTILARTEMRKSGWKGAFRWTNKRRIECCSFKSFTLPACHYLESKVAVIDSLWGLIKHTD